MVKCGVFFAVRTEFLKYHLDELRLERVMDLGYKITYAYSG
jgi:hypothetical protein